MYKPRIQPQFVERILTSPTGEQYRVVFEVTIVDGIARARAVRAERIELEALRLESGVAPTNHAPTIFSLPCSSGFFRPLISQLRPLISQVSPFTSLLFFTSQPTRAPSL